MRSARHAALLVALMLLAGCASARGGDREPFATVIIENDASSIVTVYAVRSGARMRLGTVAGLAREEFGITRSMLGPANELRLLIDALGSRQNYPADPIHVDPGDVIELRVSSLVR